MLGLVLTWNKTFLLFLSVVVPLKLFTQLSLVFPAAANLQHPVFLSGCSKGHARLMSLTQASTYGRQNISLRISIRFLIIEIIVFFYITDTNEPFISRYSREVSDFSSVTLCLVGSRKPSRCSTPRPVPSGGWGSNEPIVRACTLCAGSFLCAFSCAVEDHFVVCMSYAYRVCCVRTCTLCLCVNPYARSFYPREGGAYRFEELPCFARLLTDARCSLRRITKR